MSAQRNTPRDFGQANPAPTLLVIIACVFYCCVLPYGRGLPAQRNTPRDFGQANPAPTLLVIIACDYCLCVLLLRTAVGAGSGLTCKSWGPKHILGLLICVRIAVEGANRCVHPESFV